MLQGFLTKCVKDASLVVNDKLRINKFDVQFFCPQKDFPVTPFTEIYKLLEPLRILLRHVAFKPTSILYLDQMFAGS